MKKLNLDDLDDLVIGSTILGSGGGGDATYARAMTEFAMKEAGHVSLISFSELKADDLILPIGFMGAPLAELEKVLSGREFLTMLPYVEKIIGRKITVLMPFEIGGANAFVPLTVGAQLGLPVLDADTMGRAFPEVQMSSCHVAGISPAPGFVTDSLGNTVSIFTDNCLTMEKIARQITVAMGSIAAFCFYPLSPNQAHKGVLHKSVTKAISIGKVHRKAKENGDDPLEAILNLCKGVYLGSGKITDIDRAISKGFLKGKVIIQNKDEKLELGFQNEYLIVRNNERILATTPDILMFLEQDTGTPITSETLMYGLNVNLIALPAPAAWTTPAGLHLVGPRHFGYETDYHPVSRVKLVNPILDNYASEAIN